MKNTDNPYPNNRDYLIKHGINGVGDIISAAISDPEIKEHFRQLLEYTKYRHFKDGKEAGIREIQSDLKRVFGLTEDLDLE